MSKNTIGGHVWLALVLAMVAAVLSTSHPGDPYQALALFSAEMHLEAVAVAGAIGVDPDLMVPP